MTPTSSMLLIAAFGMTACATVQPVRDPSRFITETSPALVYVTHTNRALIAIANPRISGDTLHGIWADRTQRTIALPLDKVQGVAARQRDRRRTAFLAAGAGTVVAVGVFALLTSQSGEPMDCDYATWPPRCRS